MFGLGLCTVTVDRDKRVHSDVNASEETKKTAANQLENHISWSLFAFLNILIHTLQHLSEFLQQSHVLTKVRHTQEVMIPSLTPPYEPRIASTTISWYSKYVRFKQNIPSQEH